MKYINTGGSPFSHCTESPPQPPGGVEPSSQMGEKPLSFI
eukprot:COSAG03_NODE_19511_length_335_cov_0.733051_1_plen_39_part_10